MNGQRRIMLFLVSIMLAFIAGCSGPQQTILRRPGAIPLGSLQSSNDYWASQERIKNQIDETLYESTFGVPSRFIDMFTDKDPAVSESLVVRFLAQDGFTNRQIEDRIWDDSLKILIAMLSHSTYPNLIAIAMFPGKDRYGNSTLDPVGYIDTMRSELLKINRNAFFGRDLAGIAEIAIVNRNGILVP